MTKHTQGPWKLNYPYLIQADTGARLFSMLAQDEKGSEAAYNARLIAAAPELLEALEDLLEVVQVSLGLEARNAVAAIAKAKGNT